MDNVLQNKIDNFINKVVETEEFKKIEYLIFSIRKQYLSYMNTFRLNEFKIPGYLVPLTNKVMELFDESHINIVDMLCYMSLHNDENNWVSYYVKTFIYPMAKEKKNVSNLCALVTTGWILDSFGIEQLDIYKVVEDEQLVHKTNQYGLSVVNGVEFYNDYFVFEDKAYLYCRFTNTNTIKFGDSMPGFARIITEQVKEGNILLRLDERLALPKEQAISYSTFNFVKYRGPQFHFKDSTLKVAKNIIVHIDEKTSNKLLLVIKKRVDDKENKPFWHIEIETLPYVDPSTKEKYCITTFLHGMYFPDEDVFTHIDYTKNQYEMQIYLKKYADCEEIPVDTYTQESKLHYKIWCIEEGHYSKKSACPRQKSINFIKVL